MNNLKGIEEAVKVIVKYCGYEQHTEIECWMSPHVNSYELGVYTRHSISSQLSNAGTGPVLNELLKQIQDPIKNSDLVKDLTSDLTKQVQKITEDLGKEIETLKAELKSYQYACQKLQPYKDHYDLQFKIEHGK